MQQQRPELPMAMLTWHACIYKGHKLHQRYILKTLIPSVSQFVLPPILKLKFSPPPVTVIFIHPISHLVLPTEVASVVQVTHVSIPSLHSMAGLASLWFQFVSPSRMRLRCVCVWGVGVCVCGCVCVCVCVYRCVAVWACVWGGGERKEARVRPCVRGKKNWAMDTKFNAYTANFILFCFCFV